MKSRLCHIETIRGCLIAIDRQVEEFMEYQYRMMASAIEEIEFSGEQKQALETLLLKTYLDELPF